MNLTLSVGDVTQSINVSAEGTAIQSESSDVGTTVDTHQVVELPLALVFAGISCALCCPGFAQSKDKASAGPEQAVMRIERELLNSVLKGDPSASERYLADTYVITAPDGSVESKTQSIADLKSGDLKLQSASLDGAKVQVYGDTAVVTYSSNDKGTFKGRDISGKTRWTDVFVNRNGRWQVVASHGSMLQK